MQTTTFKDLGNKFLARFKRSHASRAAYMRALARALAGLPSDLIANTLAAYESRFAEGAAAGRSEQEIAAGLPDPRTVAAQSRAQLHQTLYSGDRTLGNLWRLLVALAGLAIMNLLLVIPAIVFGALLFAFFSVALAVYVGGIALTAGGISGVDEIEFGTHQVLLGQWQSRHAKHIEIDGEHIELGAPVAHDEGRGGHISISDGFGDDSRGIRTGGGIALIIGGIGLLLLSLLIMKYTAIAIWRYLLMQYTTLRNAWI